jgi:hypothetical protein
MSVSPEFSQKPLPYLFFRPFRGFNRVRIWTHGLRRGLLHPNEPKPGSLGTPRAAPRLKSEMSYGLAEVG